MAKLDDILTKLGPKAAEALQKLSEPQRRMLQAVAKQAGATPADQTSEAASRAIVEAIASKLGVPADSVVGNAAKALGVAGLETFADPLGPLSKGGKVLKMVQKGAKAADKAGDTAKAANTLDRWAQAAQAQKAATAERKAAGLPVADQGQFRKTLDRDVQPVVSANEAESTTAWKMKKDLIDAMKPKKDK